MKRMAKAGKPPVVIPVILVPVDVHVALVVVPAVEGEMYRVLSVSPPLVASTGRLEAEYYPAYVMP